MASRVRAHVRARGAWRVDGVERIPRRRREPSTRCPLDGVEVRSRLP